MNNQKEIDLFEKLLLSCKREGMPELLKYIKEDTDFYTAPASSRYHSCHKGGLLEHSINVYNCLLNKMNSPLWGERLKEIGKESLIISALLHDICKTNYYVAEIRNRKKYDEHGTKYDAIGRFDWEQYESFTVQDETHPLGHGEGSALILQQFIKLKPIELYMIRYHMLFTEPSEMYRTIGWAIKKFPEIIAMHEADLEATYLLEEEK